MRENKLKFKFYFMISLLRTEYLKYYDYALVDLNPAQNRHLRYVIRVEPVSCSYKFWGSETIYEEECGNLPGIN